MRRLWLVLLLSIAPGWSAFGQTLTTISDTIQWPDGSHPSGQAVISWQRFQNAANPRQPVAGGTKTITITNGVVNTQLLPLDTALPPGTCYQIAYTLNGVNSRSFWYVPTSASPVGLNLIQGNIPCSPQSGTLVSPSQITPVGTIGQCLVLAASGFGPGNCGGGGGGSPGGSNGQIQFNNSGSFGGFTMPTGILVGGAGPSMTAASYSNIINLFTGCSGSLVPSANGTCVQGGPVVQVNGVSTSVQTTINFQTASAFNGLTVLMSNPSAGNIQPSLSGTLGNAGLTNSSITITPSGCVTGGGSVSLGGTVTLNSSACVGSGTVTHTAGALTAGAVMLGNGAADATVIASLGTTTTLLHGNAGGNPSWSAVSLTADVSGTLPFANGGLGTNSNFTNHFFFGNSTGSSAAPVAVQPTFADLAAGTVGAVGTFPGGDLISGGVNAQSGTSYTVLSSDENKLVTFNNGSAVAVTLPQANGAGFTSGAFFYLFNRGAGAVTVTPTTSIINGGATIVLNQNQGAYIVSDGTNYSAWISAAPTGSGTVTNITTTAPITGGAITTTGTIACATCVTSAAALTLNRIVLGGGSQATAVLGSLGTTTTLLHGNAAGAPSFSAVALTTDVTGTLPVTNGGIGVATLSGIPFGNGASAFSVLTIGSGLQLSSSTLSPDTAVMATNAQVQSTADNVVTITSASGTTLTGTMQPTLGVYVDKQIAEFTWNVSGSGSPTINIDGLGAIPLVLQDGASSIGSSCVSGQTSLWSYDGSLGKFKYFSGCNASGSGTVTSVSFTGGLISVANPTTAAALTVAGTSGGVPYFASGSTWASSAALTANLPVIGGGAGAAPSVGTRTGNTTQFASWTGATTAARCVDTDASGNLQVVAADCGTVTTICSGTVALGTSAIASGAAATTVTATCTGLASTDNIALDFNGSPLAVTGYVPSANGMLTILKWPSTNTINISVANNTGASVTPGAITLNYHVFR